MTKEQEEECDDLNAEFDNVLNYGRIDGDMSKNKETKLTPDALLKEDVDDDDEACANRIYYF